MVIDRQKIKETFTKYVNNYNLDDPKIRLKYDHTFRVSDICEQIANNIGLSREDVDMAWLCGMLHDIGRFEQVRRYGTFNDMESIDHALLGIDILFNEGKIRDYITDNNMDNLINTAIKYHSSFRLPDDLDDRTMTFCHILRDADKIDILKVNVEVPLSDIYNVSNEEIRKYEVTEEVMESFRNKITVLRKLKKNVADNVVGHICLVYELQYNISYKIVKEQGYLDRLLAFQSDNEHTRAQFMEINRVMDEYINSKVI